MPNLSEVIAESPDRSGVRVATVATTAPLTVSLQGTTIPAGVLSSYTPVVGHVVALIRQDSTWLVLGRIL